jgi:hypothetical protein
MKHLVSLTESARQARREKFRQADPDEIWEPDYGYTIEPPGPLKRWETRPLDLPVLVAGEPAPGPADDLDLDGPVLTLVLAVEPGQERDAVRMFEEISGYEPGEVEFLAVTRDNYAAGVLQRNIGHVTVIVVPPELNTASARNAALFRARGDYVTFLELEDRLGPEAIHDLIAAHELGHGAVSVGFAELPATSAAWADHFLAGTRSDTVFTSFANEALRALGGFDERVSASVVRGHRADPSVAALVQQRYEMGAFGEGDAAGGGVTTAWAELRSCNGTLDASRPAVASLIALGAAVTWLGRTRRRIARPGPDR